MKRVIVGLLLMGTCGAEEPATMQTKVFSTEQVKVMVEQAYVCGALAISGHLVDSTLKVQAMCSQVRQLIGLEAPKHIKV